ncbi:MAG TPA: iron-sulfur cluster assembly scaffold protein [Rhizomicrobium sp.]|nr:iron-sulfur cluster assembly scaffold protein [Rhizomicrobium sp.]
MTDDPLYRREVLRLAADAMGAGRLTAPDATATAYNPACGDRVTVELALEDGRVTGMAHATQACVLTQASAALLAAKAIGQTRARLSELAEEVQAFLKGGPAPEGYQVFEGVAGHAGRHICVLLPLEAALEALERAEESAGAAKRQPAP